MGKMASSFQKNILAILTILAVGGCSHVAKETRSIAKTTDDSAITDSEAKSRETYQIKPEDILIIKVYPGEEFATPLELEVNSEGDINMPLLNRIHVAHVTPAEAEKMIAKALDEKYIVNPSVSLRVKQYHMRTVVVLGEVKRPGTYEFPPSGRLTIMKAIALAGGFTDIANSERVRLMRKRDGRQESVQVNTKDIINGKRGDVEVEPDDLITVPETFF